MDYEMIKEELEKKLRDNPLDTHLMMTLASALMECHDFEKALTLLEKAVQINPSVETLTSLGYFYLDEGEPITDERWQYRVDKSILTLERALMLNPISHFPYSALGEAYLKVDNHIKAEEVLKIATGIKPTTANLNNLGVSLYRQKKYKEAAVVFYKSHKISNKEFYSYYPYVNYGFTQAKLQNRKEVSNVCDYLLTDTVFSESDIHLLDIIFIFYENNDFEKVIELFPSVRAGFDVPTDEFGMVIFSLIKQNRKSEVADFYKHVMQDKEESIVDISNDNEIDEENKEFQINELRIEIQECRKIYLETINGIRPKIDYKLNIEGDCYLFGCLFHNNPLR